MPKTSIKVGAQTPRAKVAAQATRSKPNYKGYVPERGVMTAKQIARLGKKQQTTTRFQIHQENKTQRYIANKGAGMIKAAGEAVSQVTTPFAASYTAQKISGQKAAERQLSSLSKWNSIIDGNPDSATGSEGSSQGESTTIVGGGGSYLGG